MPLVVAHPRIRWNKVSLLAALLRKKLLDVSWLTDGYSRTFTPCSLKGNSVSPLQTTASGFTNLAAAVSSSIPSGTTPRFQLVSCRGAFGHERVPASLAPQ